MDDETAREPRLRLRFLGGCEILLPDGPARLETVKTRALLVYLSMNPAPQTRHHLMGLLWGDLPEANARRNLRRALWNLRRSLGAPDAPAPILADRETVQFDLQSDHRLDVAAFERGCAPLQAESPLPALSAGQLNRLRQAVADYRGEFLAGFHLEGAPAFEEWALVERERLRLLALRALRTLTENHARRGETETALRYARRLLSLEPWSEEAHRWTMRLLARAGRRQAALHQYETCRRLLAQELGVEPSPETTALKAQIQRGALPSPAARLPAAPTPFVGRRKELDDLTGLLSRPECRLLTVTGLGGAGKTRLALEAAARLETAFPAGVRFVPLEAVPAPEGLPAALAQALGLPLAGDRPPESILTDYLREKHLLLLLDGFEHLLGGAALLARLLREAAGLKILVTSRERLNLRGEWVYPLGGLSCPAEPEGEGQPSEAARLFIQTARRVSLGFQADAQARLHLEHICRLVDGLPLAIEMAAAWVRLLPVEEIAREIARCLDVLTLPLRDLPERHRSMRAVFTRSWDLLTPAEQEAFARLSVFQGSFRPAEARQVTGASLAVLSALVDKALLQRLPSGRYQLHALLRQYAGERLAERADGGAEARARHCQTYAALLAPYRQARDRGAFPPLPDVDLAQEIGNLRLAWQWAVEHGEEAALDAMLPALTDYFHATTAFREGESFFGRTLAALGWERTRPRGNLLPWRLLAARASFALYLGKFAAARAQLEAALETFTRLDAPDDLAHCQFFLGEIARFTGDLPAAEQRYARSLENYRRAGNRSAVGFCLNGLGLVALAQGEMRPARRHLEAGLAAFQAIGHEIGLTLVSINLADLLLRVDDRQAARPLLEESYARCRRIGHRWGAAACLVHRGDLSRREGQDEAARADYEQALEILLEIGQQRGALGCLRRLGQICAETGDTAQARTYLHRGLGLASALGDEAAAEEIGGLLARLDEATR